MVTAYCIWAGGCWGSKKVCVSSAETWPFLCIGQSGNCWPGTSSLYWTLRIHITTDTHHQAPIPAGGFGRFILQTLSNSGLLIYHSHFFKTHLLIYRFLIPFYPHLQIIAHTFNKLYNEVIADFLIQGMMGFSTSRCWDGVSDRRCVLRSQPLWNKGGEIRTEQEKESAAVQTRKSLGQSCREFWNKYCPFLSQIGLKLEMSGPLSPCLPQSLDIGTPGKGPELARQCCAAEADTEHCVWATGLLKLSSQAWVQILSLICPCCV